MDKDFNPRIAFYNVENLFDLENNPNKDDDWFLPISDTKWNQERYDKKLNDLAKVISGMNYPVLQGLCEVENLQVVQDLFSKTDLAKVNYGIVHHESPDARGIDVALAYDKKYFEVYSSEIIRINFPEEIVVDYTTRDILYVKGSYANQFDLHVFVNHWPSRRGGLKESEPKRLYVANQLKTKLDEIRSKDEMARIVIMGDFNDEPQNNSVLNTLKAGHLSGQPVANELYNCFAKLDSLGKGSYNFRGSWNMLDQVIVSGTLLGGSADLKISNPGIYRQPWMMYDDPKRGPTPNRTYGGPNYYGGYSDHLPVYVEIIKGK